MCGESGLNGLDTFWAHFGAISVGWGEISVYGGSGLNGLERFWRSFWIVVVSSGWILISVGAGLDGFDRFRVCTGKRSVSAHKPHPLPNEIGGIQASQDSTFGFWVWVGYQHHSGAMCRWGNPNDAQQRDPQPKSGTNDQKLLPHGDAIRWL